MCNMRVARVWAAEMGDAKISTVPFEFCHLKPNLTYPPDDDDPRRPCRALAQAKGKFRGREFKFQMLSRLPRALPQTCLYSAYYYTSAVV